MNKSLSVKKYSSGILSPTVNQSVTGIPHEKDGKKSALFGGRTRIYGQSMGNKMRPMTAGHYKKSLSKQRAMATAQMNSHAFLQSSALNTSGTMKDF